MNETVVQVNDVCPICSRSIPQRLLERHVNSCLDNQETTIVEDSEASPDSTLDVEIIEENKKRPVENAFSVLGLKADYSSTKKKKLEKLQKTKPTLTRILIEERKIQSQQKKKLKNESSEEPSLEELVKVIPLSTSEDVKQEEDTVKSPVAEESISVSTTTTTQPPSSPPPPRQSSYLTKAQETAKLKREASIPLAQRLRPKSLDDFFGQEKLLGKNGLLRNIIKADTIPSFLLWGSPGVGKTSLARIIAHETSCKFIELSGADANAKKLKEAFQQAENERNLTGRKTILFLDEIHRFNKAVQDLLLPVIEKGVVTVIGATTENPSFILNNALLSRMHTFVMDPLTSDDIIKVLERALYQINRLRKLLYDLHFISLKRDAFEYIAELAMGDSRVALNILESVNAYLSTDNFSINNKQRVGVINISGDLLKPLLKTRNFHNMYDKHGESHYDTISAFHKSVRGSNADAAMFYLVKMLSGGEDPMFIVRRMIVMASEDIGLRDSSCLPFAIAAKEAIEFVGMPEGEIILAHCAMKMARAPKSTKSYRALRSAQQLIRENPDITKLPIPLHIRNAPTNLMKELGYGKSYKYNPQFKNGVVKQSYFPKDMEEPKFLEPTHLGTEVDHEAPEQAHFAAENQVKEYKSFKKIKRKLLRESYLKALKRKQEAAIANIYTKNGATDTTSSPGYTYDEFLSKEDQPEYFDGEEKDEYSDDPESTNNFEKSYDEFLDPDSQPDYYVNDKTENDDPDGGLLFLD
ncbi:DNA-dependent ATPase [Scheffersomyces amazonensis]|uniref:DNA-dependent ATPase n=1 Tax=Scheffersomyces amazonensis TaxID=1078765 RepID=UPI00315CF587